ncbi:uncharacterized protein LOC122504890 [Leptopilina heterotoma]|uniref:uncharacterized protein LOC122504890 n=1 Tax=Leptopilina heterotoma TaxID=63436 RepID=UPI001CA9D231|nr:uncharacterized protein LOC122504890 [Leptopilina heterotoma]
MYNRNFLKYFQINKLLLQFSGVLPFLSCGFLVNGIFIVMPISTCLFLSLPGFYVMISRLKITAAMEMLDTFCELIEFLVVSFQVLVLLPKRRKIVNLVNLCNDLWENVKEKEEAQAVMGYATIALYLTYGFTINVFIALTGLMIQPLFTQFVYDANGTMIVSKQLPYSSGIFYENVRIFNIWYILQIPAGLISIIPVIAIATAIPFFVFHACAHFKLLQYQISKLKSENSGHSVEDGTSRSTFEEIVGVVKQHQRVLK